MLNLKKYNNNNKKNTNTNQRILSYYLLRLMYTVKYINIINNKEYKYYN